MYFIKVGYMYLQLIYMYLYIYIFDINGLAFWRQKMRSIPALFSVSVEVDDKNSSQCSLEVCAVIWFSSVHVLYMM